MPATDPKPSCQDFELLGVTPGVTALHLKRAYREKVKLWHPDRFQYKGDGDRRAAEEQFKAINRAYHTILANLDLSGHPREGCDEGENPGNVAKGESPTETENSEAKQQAFVKPKPGGLRRMKSFVGGKRVKDLLSGLPGFCMKKERIAFLVAVFAGIVLAVNWNAWLGNHPERVIRETREISSVKPGKTVAKPVEEESRGESRKGSASTSEDLATDSAIKIRDPSPEYFSIGSNEHQVLAAQGRPSRIKGKTWFYNLSEVTFKDGLVVRYNNFDGSLRIRMTPSDGVHAEGKPFFTLGSTKDEVLLTQGAPTRVSGNRWYYGFSEVRFKDGRVESFDNFFGNLKIRMIPSAVFMFTEKPAFFSVGSSKDEVLAVQGTPSSIQAGLWSYGSATIQFRDDRVQSVFGDTASLHFMPREDMSAAGE